MEGKKEPPPTDCKVCKEPNCNDWMYLCNLVPASQAICGKCKIEIGEAVMTAMQDGAVKRWELKISPGGE